MSGDGSCYHAHPLLTATQRRRRTDGPDDDGRRKVVSDQVTAGYFPRRAHMSAEEMPQCRCDVQLIER